MAASYDLTRMMVPGCRAIIAYAGKTFPALVTLATQRAFTVQTQAPGPGDPLPSPGERVALLAQDDHGLAFFDSRILACTAGHTPRLDLEWPSRFEWRPRREHARVQERLPVTLIPTPEAGSRPEVRYRGHTANISVGGLQVLLAGVDAPSLERGKELSAVVEVPDGWPPLEATVTVVRVASGTVAGEPALSLALQFTAASEQAWDRISRYVQICLRRANDHRREMERGPRRRP